MKCIYITTKLFVYTIILIVNIFMAALANLSAQELIVQPNAVDLSNVEAVKLAGKVVDIEGKPVPGFKFSILSMPQLGEGIPGMFVAHPQFIVELMQNQNEEDLLESLAIVETEEDGTFKSTEILPGLVKINALPDGMMEALKRIDPKKPEQMFQQQIEVMSFGENRSEMQILSIQLNKITFFPFDDMGPLDGLTFGLKPGTNIDDLKITVKKLLKIRAQIVYADGTPVKNEDVRLSIQYKSTGGSGGSGTDGTSCTTDDEGYFTDYRDEPGMYTLSAKHKTFSGGAGPFLIDKGVHPEKIVITLDGTPIKKNDADAKEENVGENVPPVDVEALAAGVNVPVLIEPPIGPANVRQAEELIWIINPANGHAYAQITCNGWLDAQQKAIAEESHLLSINDEDENIWIQIMFNIHHYWIGLNDVQEEGVWRWDSGEPVTYTNWSPHEIFGDESPDAEKDFVAVTHFEHGWQAASEKSILWRIARHAIIEKDGMISKVAEPDPEPEEE